MNWDAFQACLEERLPVRAVTNHEEEIVNYVEEQISAIQEATTSKHRPHADPHPLLHASSLDRIHLKDRLRQRQIMRDPH
jgi:hypothetical protein